MRTNKVRLSILPLSTLVLVGIFFPLRAATFSGSGTQGTLLELYSSEGCSSCPPAEAWVSTLKDSPRLWHDLFPVAFHVDYWDGGGWPDRFARPAYTERQRDYAKRLGQDSVYTPEFIISGREWHEWFDGARNAVAAQPTKGELTVSLDGESSARVAYVPSAGSAPGVYVANVVLLGMGITSNVRGGENGGRQLQHDFVVLDFQSGPMTPAATEKAVSKSLAFTATQDRPAAAVAWISGPGGVILQVAGGFLERAVTATH